MSRSHRFSVISFAIAALAPTWAVWRMADEAPAIAAAAAAPVETAAQVTNDTATAEAADASAATAEAAQDTSDEAPATVSIDVPAQHKTLLERIAAVLEKGEQWIVDNVEGGVAHFESLVGIEPKAADDSAKD